MKAKLRSVESIDSHRTSRIRAVRAEDIALEVNQQLGDFTLTAIYQNKIRPQRTRQYELHGPSKKASVEVLHTLLGIELKVGNRRLLCPDLATASAAWVPYHCDSLRHHADLVYCRRAGIKLASNDAPRRTPDRRSQPSTASNCSQKADRGESSSDKFPWRRLEIP